MGNLELFLPEVTILGGALVLFVLSMLGASYRVIWGMAVLLALAGVAVTLGYMKAEGEPFFPGIYAVDGFTQLLKLGIVGGLLLTLMAAGNPGSFRARVRVDVPMFLFFSTVGMMMLVSATELLTLYVALELSAYGLYILAALHHKQKMGSEGAAKYVLFGSAASAVTLFGISLIYGAALASGVENATYLAALAEVPMTPMYAVGILLALSGLLFKLAVFPFHAWAPDTYEAAPHEAATFIGTASKVAAVGILVRLALLASPDQQGVVTILLILCVASMTIGNLAAIVQKDMKRLLAYSTVAHAGYILIGLLCYSQMGIASAIFYALIYVPIVFCAFVVVCVLGANGSNPSKTSLAGLYQRSPLLAATLLVGLFGLAGIPPTSGFAGKWFLFTAAVDSDLLWLVLVAAINATVSLYYYLRMLKEAYLTPPEEGSASIPLSPSVTLAAWVGIALVAVAGFYPRPLWELAEAAAKSVLGG